jgi:hypothetical protein
MSLTKQQLVTLSDRYTIAELRQLIKAHNRFDDISVPKKAKKEQIINGIYKIGFKLSDKGGKKLTQVRKPIEVNIKLKQARDMKESGYKNNRSGYKKAK